MLTVFIMMIDETRYSKPTNLEISTSYFEFIGMFNFLHMFQTTLHVRRVRYGMFTVIKNLENNDNHFFHAAHRKKQKTVWASGKSVFSYQISI